ncbi:MAG: DMT family transporter [Acidobacteriota bacterium]
MGNFLGQWRAALVRTTGIGRALGDQLRPPYFTRSSGKGKRKAPASSEQRVRIRDVASPGRFPAKIVWGLTLGLLGISWGSILVRLAQEAPSLTIAAYRMAWATVLLAPAYFTRARRPLLAAIGAQWVPAVALAVHFAAWIASLRYTSVAVSVILVNTAPVWTALWSWRRGSESFRSSASLGVFLCCAGSLLLFFQDFSLSRDWRGPALALVGALALSVYLLAGRRLRREVSLLEYVFPVYLAAAGLLLFLVLVLRLPAWDFAPSTHFALFALGLVPQVLGHSSYNWALRHVPATSVAVVIVGEPVLATLLAWWLLDESPPAFLAPAGLLTLAGIILAVRGIDGAPRRGIPAGSPAARNTTR